MNSHPLRCVRAALAPIILGLVLACTRSAAGPPGIGADSMSWDDSIWAQPFHAGERIAGAPLVEGVGIPGHRAVVGLMEASTWLCTVDRFDLDTDVRTRLAGSASCDHYGQMLAISPDGTTLYYVVPADAAHPIEGPTMIRRLILATGSTADLAAIPFFPGALALSPDGNLLTYSFYEDWDGVSASGPELHVRDLTTESDQLIALQAPDVIAFSPDGRQVVFPATDTARGDVLERLNLATGAADVLSPPWVGGDVSWTSFGLQYATLTACPAGPPGCRVLTNATTGDQLDMGGNFMTLAWSPEGRHVAGEAGWSNYAVIRTAVAVADWTTHQGRIIGREDDDCNDIALGAIVLPEGDQVVYGLCSGTYLWTRP